MLYNLSAKLRHIFLSAKFFLLFCVRIAKSFWAFCVRIAKSSSLVRSFIPLYRIENPILTTFRYSVLLFSRLIIIILSCIGLKIRRNDAEHPSL